MSTRTIFYVNVGSLPQAKVKAYVDSMIEVWKGQAEAIPGDQVLYIPVRDVETHVEVLHYDD